MCCSCSGRAGTLVCTGERYSPGSPFVYAFLPNIYKWSAPQFEDNTCGVMINDIDVTCPAYADDVAICALHKTGLNILLQIAYSYSKKWLFEFSIEKSVIMTWGRDQFPEIPVMLGDSKLKNVEHCKHVGIELANSKAGKDRIIHERIGKARHAILAARGIGYSNTPVSVTVLSKIYWAIAVARMTYGLEVDVIHENNMEELEKAHRHHAKIVQDIPNMVHKSAVLAPLGWLSMKGYIAIKKMCFLWSILCYPDTGIYRTIALLIINKCNANDGGVRWSPIADMYNTFCKYNMKSVLMSCIQHNECYPGNDMKRIIKKAVWKHEFESWVASQFMYPELDCYYKGVKNISMHCWWRYAAKNPRMTTPVSSVVSVMMGSQPKSLQCNFNKQTCNLCYGQLRDNAIHVIYECPELEYTRSDAWTKVLASMPSAMANQIDTFSAQNKLLYILSGLQGPYAREWDDIYRNIARLVHRMYLTRYQLYNSISSNNIWDILNLCFLQMSCASVYVHELY